MVIYFCEDQIFVDFVGFLSMIIYEVLHTRCLRYNICSAWFLDIRILTCSIQYQYNISTITQYQCNIDNYNKAFYKSVWYASVITFYA